MASAAPPELPQAVQNLRRIWKAKKYELGINQSEAAEALGWTQGAFSQYLNNLSDLNITAITKLANFLGVDPLEIDPEVHKKLPKHSTVSFIHGSAEPDVKVNRGEMEFAILLKKETVIPWRDSRFIAPTGTVLLCGKPKQHDLGPFAYTLKTRTSLVISKKRPEKSKVKFLYSINYISLK